MPNHPVKTTLRQAGLLAACFVSSLILAEIAQPTDAHAESLFRASTTYATQEPLRSRSLFTPPISRQVGDMVTINIDEETELTTDAELKITRNQTIDENGSSLYNSTLGFFVDKLPFGGSTLKKIFTAPTFNGLDNQNQLSSKAESTRTTSLKDNITCQVVQILPNGNLVVQGQKVVQVNKERGDMIVTGIVNPYYLDRNNQISSKMVANFQMLQGGKGVISRQQNDGIANKIYQFFN